MELSKFNRGGGDRKNLLKRSFTPKNGGEFSFHITLTISPMLWVWFGIGVFCIGVFVMRMA